MPMDNRQTLLEAEGLELSSSAFMEDVGDWVQNGSSEVARRGTHQPNRSGLSEEFHLCTYDSASTRHARRQHSLAGTVWPTESFTGTNASPYAGLYIVRYDPENALGLQGVRRILISTAVQYSVWSMHDKWDVKLDNMIRRIVETRIAAEDVLLN